MSNTTKAETLTNKLHARSDKKLRAYCKTRFGDLFEIVGGCGGSDGGCRVDFTSHPRSNSYSAFLRNPSKVWHGSVWSLAEDTLFELLRDKWRTKEVNKFLTSVEETASNIEELRKYE